MVSKRLQGDFSVAHWHFFHNGCFTTYPGPIYFIFASLSDVKLMKVQGEFDTIVRISSSSPWLSSTPRNLL